MTRSVATCVEYKRLSRRSFLQCGALAAAGLSLTDLLRLQAAPSAQKNDKAVILLWMDGGPSHIDTFDPKPDAPVEIRGEFQPTATTVPGELGRPMPILPDGEPIRELI